MFMVQWYNFDQSNVFSKVKSIRKRDENVLYSETTMQTFLG